MNPLVNLNFWAADTLPPGRPGGYILGARADLGAHCNECRKVWERAVFVGCDCVHLRIPVLSPEGDRFGPRGAMRQIQIVRNPEGARFGQRDPVRGREAVSDRV